MTHELKCWPDFFAALWDGRKTFEARRNDRDYRAGDALFLREWSPADGLQSALGEYTGRTMTFLVTYVLPGSQDNNKTGIREGYCVMGIKRDWQADKKSKK